MHNSFFLLIYKFYILYRCIYQTFFLANFIFIAVPCVQIYLWCGIVHVFLCCVLFYEWRIGVQDVWVLSKVYDIVKVFFIWANEWMRYVIYLILKCYLHFYLLVAKSTDWTCCEYLTINKINIIIDIFWQGFVLKLLQILELVD